MRAAHAQVLALVLLPLIASAADAPAGSFRRKVAARDGVALALYRLAPSGGASLKPPVLLVPELGFGREAYDFAGEGLARFLLEHGREVFVLEPRGHGQSAASRGWRLADLVEKDLPAGVEAVRALRPGPIDLVVHGYSGTLVLAACSRELSGSVRRVVALSTPVLPEVPSPLAASFLQEGGRLAMLSSDPEGARIFDLLFAHGGAFKPGRLRPLHSAGVTDLGKPAATDLLGWMTSGDLTLADGTTVAARLASYDRPTLLVLPLRDNFAHPEFASPLREQSKARVTVRILSKRELMNEDYSHLSMLHGTGARADIFVPALAFLDSPEPKAAAEVAQ